MKEEKTFNIISIHRNVLYSLAIISIVIFHYGCILKGTRVLDSFFWKKYMRYVGSVGVEMFLFLSGMGLFFSMKKSTVLQFWKKRFLRIILPYLIVGTVDWYVQDLWRTGEGITHFLKDYFWISFFTEGNNHFWFVLFILCMYLIYPIFFKALNGKGYIPGLGMVILLCGTILFNYLLKLRLPGLFHNVEIALTRISVFLVGCYVGKLIYDQVEWNHGVMISVMIVALCLRYVNQRFLGIGVPWSRYIVGIYGIGLESATCEKLCNISGGDGSMFLYYEPMLCMDTRKNKMRVNGDEIKLEQVE